MNLPPRSSLLMFECSGDLFWKSWKHLAKLRFDMPKSYRSHMMNLVEKPCTHMLLAFALSFVKLLWPLSPRENSFHALMIKIHVHTTISPLLCFYNRAYCHSCLHFFPGQSVAPGLLIPDYSSVLLFPTMPKSWLLWAWNFLLIRISVFPGHFFRIEEGKVTSCKKNGICLEAYIL
jgi:hypothetical protein